MAYKSAEEERAYQRAYYKKHRERSIAQARAWRLNNPEKMRECSRDSNLRTRIGITYQEKVEMWEGQGRRCGVCEAALGMSDAVADHCHHTLRFRGVLCHRCNLGVGLLQESPSFLRRAALYLESAP